MIDERKIQIILWFLIALIWLMACWYIGSFLVGLEYDNQQPYRSDDLFIPTKTDIDLTVVGGAPGSDPPPPEHPINSKYPVRPSQLAPNERVSLERLLFALTDLEIRIELLEQKK